MGKKEHLSGVGNEGQSTERRKPPGAGLGLAILLAFVFWIGLFVALMVLSP